MRIFKATSNQGLAGQNSWSEVNIMGFSSQANLIVEKADLQQERVAFTMFCLAHPVLLGTGKVFIVWLLPVRTPLRTTPKIE